MINFVSIINFVSDDSHILFGSAAAFFFIINLLNAKTMITHRVTVAFYLVERRQSFILFPSPSILFLSSLKPPDLQRLFVIYFCIDVDVRLSWLPLHLSQIRWTNFIYYFDVAILYERGIVVQELFSYFTLGNIWCNPIYISKIGVEVNWGFLEGGGYLFIDGNKEISSNRNHKL